MGLTQSSEIYEIPQTISFLGTQNIDENSFQFWNEFFNENLFSINIFELEKFILEKCVQGDLLITMGAGDIVKVGENLLGI